MENASKALIMAGSILISIMIIGLVVFSYNQIVSVQRIKDNADSVSKLTEYSKMFEQYNTSIYGSELLSLANLQEYYKVSQKDVEGYDEIKIVVKIKNQIKDDDNKKLYLKSGECDLTDVRIALTDLEDDIANYEDANKKGYKNEIEKKKGARSVKYYAQLSNRQIAVLFEVPFTSGEEDSAIVDKLTTFPKTADLMKDIDKYKNLKTMYTGFKNTVFTCEKTGYNKYNGRINEMYFKEK